MKRMKSIQSMKANAVTGRPNLDRLVPFGPRTACCRVALIAICLMSLAGSVAAQDFSASVNPNPIVLQVGGGSINVQVATTMQPDPMEVITYRFLDLPAFVSTVGNRQVTPPGYPIANFPFSLTGGATPGTFNIRLEGTAGPFVEVFPVTLIVQPPPSFRVRFDPDPIEVFVGAPGERATADVIPDPGFNSPVGLSLEGLPSFLTVSGLRTVTTPYSPLAVTVSAAANATPGTYNGVLRGGGGGQQFDDPVTVIVRRTPSFVASLDPNPVELAIGAGGMDVVVRTAADRGFTAPISYRFSGLPSFVRTEASRTVSGPSYPAARFSVSLTGGASPGSFSGVLVGQGGGQRVEVPVTVIVRPPSTFGVSLSPTTVRLTPGSGSQQVRADVDAASGFTSAVSLRFADLPAFIRTGGTRTSSAPTYPTTSFPFSLGSAATPGTYQGRLIATGGGQTEERKITVIVGQGARLAVIATPQPMVLEIGGSGAILNVATSGVDTLTTPVEHVISGLPGFISSGGLRATLPPSFPAVSFPVSLNPGAVAGTYTGVLRSTARGMPTLEQSIQVIVRALAPVIDRVEPGFVAAGARRQQIRLTGRRFEPGARLSSDNKALRIDNVRIVGPTSAIVLVSSRKDAAGRLAGLRLTNPNGASSVEGVFVRVVGPDSLAAPLAVTGTSIVYPRAGVQIGVGERIHPRAVLTTSGTGPILGSWTLDGVAFDRFATVATAGRPVTVTTAVPLPRLSLGRHRLGLRLESPQRITAPEVAIQFVGTESARFQTVWPEDDAIVAPEGLVLRWTLVPGAESYRVEVEDGDSTGSKQTVTHETVDAFWEPPLDALRNLDGRKLRWRVRARFPAGDLGEATEWSHFTLADEPRNETVSGAAFSGVTFSGAAFSGAAKGPGGDSTSHRWAGQRPDRVEPARMLWAQDDPDTVLETEFEEAAEPLATWRLGAELGATDMSGDQPLAPAEARIALSGQATLHPGAVPSLDTTTEVGWFQDLDTEDASLDHESENWLLHAGLNAGDGDSARGQVRVGYGTASFLYGLELLDGGLVRGGAEASFGYKESLSVSAYRSFDPEIGNASGGSLGGEQKLSAGGIVLGSESSRAEVRILGLEVEEDASDFEPGVQGESFGFYGRLALGASARLTLEAARGELTPDADSFETARQGDAWTLNLEGDHGQSGYALRLRSADREYVNPANRGLTPLGGADRESIELDLRHGFEATQLDLRLEHLRGGDGWGPAADVSNVVFGIQGSPSAKFQYSINLRGALTEADEDLELFTPAVERRDYGISISLNQSIGTWQVGQTASHQRQEDRLQSDSEMTATDVGFSLFGSIGSSFSLSTSIGGNRADAGTFGGTTDSWTVSIQPEWRAGGWSLRPMLSYNALDSPDSGLDLTTEQAMLTIGWNPTWLNSFLGLEATGDWSRMTDHLLGSEEDTLRWTFNLSLRFGAEGQANRSRQSGASAASRAAGYSNLDSIARRRALASMQRRSL